MDQIAQACAIIRRKAWGARPSARPLDPDWNYDSIVVHYTGHDNLTTMPAIQAFDLDHRHWDDIAYHYAIAMDGRIFEGRELVSKGSHVRNQNSGKIGVVCMGHFDEGVMNWLRGRSYAGDSVRPPMLAALRHLASVLRGAFPIPVFGGHMEFGDSATCPGNKLLPEVETMRRDLGFKPPVHRSL